MGETTVAEYERRFRRAGLPLLIEDRTAREDVWTRTLPVLVLVFAIEALGAVDLQWEWWQNALALAGAGALLLAAWVLSNRARGRPSLARPQDVGRAELAGFVVVPALLPLVFNGQTTSAAVTAVGNTALLAILYGVVAYGLLSIVRWAAGRLLGQLAGAVLLLARALPLLMLFSVVLLFTTEMWQVFAEMNDETFAAVVGLLVAIGTLFLIARIPTEVTALEDAVDEGPPLDTRQRVNVGLVMFVSQGLQVLVVSTAVAAFFVAFGLLAMPAELIREWAGQYDALVTVFDVEVSVELLRVAGSIGALSGLYYAIATLTDETYRKEFLSELTDEMRATFHDRVAYLQVRATA
ncbi:MAG TPA: hypothetical protein VFZ89_14280 [Solirubrobacteraceae bacterium]